MYNQQYSTSDTGMYTLAYPRLTAYQPQPQPHLSPSQTTTSVSRRSTLTKNVLIPNSPSARIFPNPRLLPPPPTKRILPAPPRPLPARPHQNPRLPHPPAQRKSLDRLRRPNLAPLHAPGRTSRRPKHLAPPRRARAFLGGAHAPITGQPCDRRRPVVE